MTPEPDTLTVLAVDMGEYCALIQPDDGGPAVLVVRPHPHQTLDSAVDRANRILSYSPEKVRELLRPHFPTEPAPLGTITEPSPATTALRARVRTTERRHHLMWWLVAGAVGIMFGLLIATLTSPTEPPPPSGVADGPLNDPEVTNLLDLWGVSCSTASDHWTASCQGPVVGGFTVVAYTTRDGVLLSTRVGLEVINMRLVNPGIPHSVSAGVYNRIRAGYDTTPGWGFALLQHDEHGDLVVWGGGGHVAALTKKGIDLGYTTLGGPPKGEPPTATTG